jgi:hypothetical protein
MMWIKDSGSSKIKWNLNMDDVHFLVGKSPEGYTILRVGDSVSTTLTMDQKSTVDLIKLLVSTLDEDKWKFAVNIQPKDKDNE